jgi:hypothetical protein
LSSNSIGDNSSGKIKLLGIETQETESQGLLQKITIHISHVTERKCVSDSFLSVDILQDPVSCNNYKDCQGTGYITLSTAVHLSVPKKRRFIRTRSKN